MGANRGASPQQRAPQRGGAPGPMGGGLKPGAPAAKGSKDNFVICEICDGYIRDLEQLRNHMQFIHKVKIHPKMIHNRPPLNCQKCQFRFFTDQVRVKYFFSVKSQCDKDLSKALFESLGSCIRRIPFLVQPDVPTTYLLIQVQNCNAFKILDLRIFLISKFYRSKSQA